MGRILQGTAEVSNADTSEVIIAQPTTDPFMILKGFVTVTVASVGGNGQVTLRHGIGGTHFMKWSAAAVGTFPVDFGPNGYGGEDNKGLILFVTGATTQASARATFLVRINEN